MAIGLYELIGGAKNGELSSEDIDVSIKEGMSAETKKRLLRWKKELNFWERYGEIYYHLEDTIPYYDLARTIQELVDHREGEVWLDAGCGPAKMSQILWEKSNRNIDRVIGIDIVLDPARATLERLDNSIPLELQYANLGERLPFVDGSFDGIVANLVLPYVFDFEGKEGREAFAEAMKEMFRILRSGGRLIWSSPKKNPFFFRNFLLSLPDMLSIRKQIAHRVFGPWIGLRILKYGIAITLKGRKGIYTFLDKEEFDRISQGIGFVNSTWRRSFAKQVWVNRVEKPNTVC